MMIMTTDETEPTPSLQQEATTQASRRMRTTMAAARVRFSWFGTRKTLTSAQKSQAADSFGAESKILTAGKKLLDTSHPVYLAVTAIRSQAVAYWKGISLPYPEPGIRLIGQAQMEVFDERMQSFQEELQEAVGWLDQHYEELRLQARRRLGDLFSEDDYPVSLQGLFTLEHDFPNVEPPDYLRQLQPELYAQECQRVQARFEEAVQLAEQAFGEELARLVEHLTERLQGSTAGKPKVFRDTAVTHLTEFFDRFQNLNVHSSADLDALVEQARQILQGVGPQHLRDQRSLRNRVAQQMTSVQAQLDQLLIDRPRRQLLRKPQEGR